MFLSYLENKKLTLNCQVLQYLLIYITVAFILNVLLFNRVNPAFVGCSLILVSLIFLDEKQSPTQMVSDVVVRFFIQIKKGAWFFFKSSLF